MRLTPSSQRTLLALLAPQHPLIGCGAKTSPYNARHVKRKPVLDKSMIRVATQLPGTLHINHDATATIGEMLLSTVEDKYCCKYFRVCACVYTTASERACEEEAEVCDRGDPFSFCPFAA